MNFSSVKKITGPCFFCWKKAEGFLLLNGSSIPCCKSCSLKKETEEKQKQNEKL